MQILEIRQNEGLTIIEPIRKRLDASLAVRFREELVQLVEQGHRKLVVNLQQVEFIDSSGLGALVSVMKALGGNQNLVLCQVRETVLGLFKLTRMDKIFLILPTESEALARLKQ